MSRVLVAEDEPALLECFRDIVLSLGHECVEAQDGNQAVDLARKYPPDLIITDYMMPGRTGAEVIAYARRDPVLEKVPAILISAGRPPEAERRLAWRFLSKPLNLEAFERAIVEGLQLGQDRGRPNPMAIAGVPASATPESVVREQMLGWVAHEIKTPLSAAMTAGQLALRELRAAPSEATATLERRLTVIHRQLSRMDELVNSVLDAAQLQEEKLHLNLETVRISELVAKVVSFWKDMHSEYEFVVEDGDGLTVEGDSERLRQILDNLVSNAVKYGGASKKVWIGTSRTEANVSIWVRDEGSGIPEREHANIFNRFHRVAGQGGRGHGLGLYVAAALARLHAGAIKVESELDRGSTFTLLLPLKA